MVRIWRCNGRDTRVNTRMYKQMNRIGVSITFYPNGNNALCWYHVPSPRAYNNDSNCSDAINGYCRTGRTPSTILRKLLDDTGIAADRVITEAVDAVLRGALVDSSDTAQGLAYAVSLFGSIYVFVSYRGV